MERCGRDEPEQPAEDCREQNQPNERDAGAAEHPVDLDLRGVRRRERDQEGDERDRENCVAVESAPVGLAAEVLGPGFPSVTAEACAGATSGPLATGDPLLMGPVTLSGTTPGASERTGVLRVLDSIVRTSSGWGEGIFRSSRGILEGHSMKNKSRDLRLLCMTENTVPSWTFLTNHAQVLVCIAQDPGIRLRDIGERVGITERAAHRIVVELADAGYITRERNGRRNHYTINTDFPLPDRVAREQNVGELLAILTGPPAAKARVGRSGTSG